MDSEKFLEVWKLIASRLWWLLVLVWISFFAGCDRNDAIREVAKALDRNTEAVKSNAVKPPLSH